MTNHLFFLLQEQITRVLLERLIVNRPHPWGLLITFIELIKNPNYKFWDHDFVHCAPEIEKWERKISFPWKCSKLFNFILDCLNPLLDLAWSRHNKIPNQLNSHRMKLSCKSATEIGVKFDAIDKKKKLKIFSFFHLV